MKGSARPLLGSAAGATGASAANLPPLVVQSPRSSNLCIGLLVVCILLQLYVISLWMAPVQPLPVTQSGTGFTDATARPDLPSTTMSVIQEQRQRASQVNTLPDSGSALTALQLLQKYIRMHQQELDSAGTGAASKKRKAPSGVSMLDVGDDHKHAGPHAEPGPTLRTPIGAGPTLGAHEHADGAEHGAEDGEHEHHAEDDHDEAYLQAHPELYHQIWLNISHAWATDILSPETHHRISEEDKATHAQCLAWEKEYNVRVDSSWGTLPPALQKEFDAKRCSDAISRHLVATYILEHPELYDRVVPVPEQRDTVQPEAGYEGKVIAIIASLTTRGLQLSSHNDLALFKHLLPSLVDTAEAGFEYWFYVGYDAGDPWFDNADHLATARAWFLEHVTAPLQAKGIVAKLVIATWKNPTKKPGPAFNYVTAVAYEDGATWIYRVNDDVRFDTPWAAAFVAQQEAWGPPYGVVGPKCGQGASHILVVDFTHRTHHEIFPTHYPPSLISWWMDDWVTQVYGKQRTSRVATTQITHLTGSHGQRYSVAMGGYFRGEIQRGRKMMEEYLAHTPGMKKELERYKQDVFAYTI